MPQVDGHACIPHILWDLAASTAAELAVGFAVVRSAPPRQCTAIKDCKQMKHTLEYLVNVYNGHDSASQRRSACHHSVAQFPRTAETPASPLDRFNPQLFRSLVEIVPLCGAARRVICYNTKRQVANARGVIVDWQVNSCRQQLH
jgi:hypothetical protein